MVEEKPIWEGMYKNHYASVCLVDGEAQAVLAGNRNMFRTDHEGIMETAVRELAAKRDELDSDMATIGRNICGALNYYRVQPAKLQPPVEALKQLLKWVDMKRAERDEEERRRVSAQKEATELRERLAVVESEASRRVESLQAAVAALELAHDAFYDALILIRRDEDPMFTGDVAAALAGIVGAQLTPTTPAKLADIVLEFVRAERRCAHIDRNRLAKLEAAARAVVATHDEFRVSTEHSDAIWALKELIGDDNG